MTSGEVFQVRLKEAEAEKKSLDDQRATLEKMMNADAKEFE